MGPVYIVEALQPGKDTAAELRKISDAAAPGRVGFMENSVKLHFPNRRGAEARSAVERALVEAVGEGWERSYRVHPSSTARAT